MEYKVDLTRHSVDTVVVSCSDFRFRPMIANWIEKRFGEADLVAMPGASKAVLEVDGIKRNIETLVGLHKIKKIVIVDHMDCSAYGGSEAFDWDPTAEVGLHYQKLSEAKEELLKTFPTLEVGVFLLGIEGELAPIGQSLNG
jgi:carbonic anhydrase